MYLLTENVTARASTLRDGGGVLPEVQRGVRVAGDPAVHQGQAPRAEPVLEVPSPLTIFHIEDGAQKCPRLCFDAKTMHETMVAFLEVHGTLFLAIEVPETLCLPPSIVSKWRGLLGLEVPVHPRWPEQRLVCLDSDHIVAVRQIRRRVAALVETDVKDEVPIARSERTSGRRRSRK